MKRLTLLTILLVVVGLTAGAIEVKPAFTLSGTGTLQWGIDLDDMGTGFKNSTTGDLVISLMAKDGSDTHAGTGDWYGSISIANVELYWTDGVMTAGAAEANVTAKIVGLGGALVIGVVPVAGPTGPDLTLDYLAALEADADDTDLVVDDESGVDVFTNYDGFGTFVSYTLSEALMVGLEVVSQYDWTANETNGYAGAIDIQAKFAPLTINAGVNYGTYKIAKVPPLWDVDVYNALGFGVKVAADTAMVDATVAFDGQFDNDAFVWEVGATVTFTVIETVTAAFTVVYNDPSFDVLDLSFVLTEPAAAGLVDNLDAKVTVYLLDIGGVAGLEYEVKVAGGYLMDKLYPHFYVTYGDANDAAAFLNVGVGVDYTLFTAAKTVLSLDWASGDLLAPTPVMGTVIAGVTITY